MVLALIRKVYFLLFFISLGSPIWADPALLPKTFFDYTQEEINSLNGAFTDHILSNDELRKWDAIAAKAVEEKKLTFFEYTRLFSYLYVAQADAAILTQTLKGNLEGSFDPVSNKVLAIFLANYTLPELYEDDSYAEALGQIISKKVRERVEKENALQTSYIVPQKLQKDFSAGLITARWIPWFAKPAIAYWPNPPPEVSDPIWKEQVAAIKKAQEPMTLEKKQVIYRWAGLAYPWSSDWRTVANGFLFCHDYSLSSVIKARAAVAVGLYDCLAAYASCKYHYLVIRPQVYDASVTYIIPVPKHPSYPSGHSTESTVTATIMSALFPPSSEYWSRISGQCCQSRIWAGIHYPLDDQAGRICGKKVAETVIKNLF